VAASKTIGSREIQAAIARLAAAISARHPDSRGLLLLGIANGGIELTCRLARLTGARAGVIDVSFHRDDIALRPIPKARPPTHIPGEVGAATVILIDDVLFSGRTIKAALDELFDYDRPARVELAVLVDRGGRRLPIAADYVGLALPTAETERVEVTLDAVAEKRDRIRVLTAAVPPLAGPLAGRPKRSR
jgi:pyrimidine operon attenuation protein/uracil phosphoribosyltransferase